MTSLTARVSSVRMALPFALLPFLCVFAGCHQKQPTSQAQTTVYAPVAVARVTPLSNKLVVAGEFLPFQQVELHAKVAGYIREINADIGDHVHKGEVLATLDVPELQDQVLGANATVRQSTERIAQARSDVKRAQASYAALHSAAERLEQASKAQPGLVAQQELDDANARSESAFAQVDAAKDALAAAQEGLQVSQATSAQLTSMDDYSRITAPFNGVVTWRYADTGALIQAGTSNSASMPVLKIAQVDKLRLRIPVPESLVEYVKDGDQASIEIDALDRTIHGTVTRSTDALDDSTRTEQVEIDVPNPDGSIEPGMFGKVTLNIHTADSLSVPISAVNTGTGQPFVLTVDANGIVHQQTIVEGIVTVSRVQVLSGLQAGAKVIVANLGSYSDGEHVVPRISPISISSAEGN